MPIFVYSCINCKNQIEKITLKPVKDNTVPAELKERCEAKCSGAVTRHLRCITAPSYVGLTPPATSAKVTTMQEMRPARDKNWKNRVKSGLNPAGKKLKNLKKENRQEWEATVKTAFPDLKDKREEVNGRVRTGEFQSFFDATSSTK